MQKNGPKPLKGAQQAVVLHTGWASGTSYELASILNSRARTPEASKSQASCHQDAKELCRTRIGLQGVNISHLCRL